MTTPTPDRASVQKLVLDAVRSNQLESIAPELNSIYAAAAPFPADLLLDLGVAAMAAGGFSADRPLDGYDIRRRFLPDVPFRGNLQHQKSMWAIRAVACSAGGLRPDLAEDTGWWGTQDPCWWLLLALTLYVRAAADEVGSDVPQICRRIGEAA